MIYGYARVSSKSQYRDGNSMEEQIGQLQRYGCDEIIQEAYTGKLMDRPQFKKLLKKLKENDMLVVTKLDRFARTTIEGVQTVKELCERGVKVNVLNIGIVEDSLIGNLILTIMLAFAEFERGSIIERTQAGKEIARQNPDYREGRPKKYRPAQIAHAMDLLSGGMSYKKVENVTGISKSTLVRAKRELRNTN